MARLVIYTFLGIMWSLILAGGGILTVLVSKIEIRGYGEELDFLIASGIKAIIAIILVVLWVMVLLKLKNRIFQKQMKF